MKTKVLVIFKILLLAISVVFLFLGLYLLLSRTSKEADFIFSTKPIENNLQKKYIQISGAIQNPGIYEIDKSITLETLIKLAGGFTNDADIDLFKTSLNLNDEINNEKIIEVPSINTNIPTKNISNSLVDINNATLNELMELPGIGEITAKKIIDARPFKVIEDILKVNGIGDVKYSKIKNLIKI